MIEAIGLLRDMLAGTITSSEKIGTLNTILNKSIPASEIDENFIELLHYNNILFYENSGPWYEVNPIIRNTVKNYASSYGYL